MPKTEAILTVQPANDEHGGIVPKLGPPGTVATVAESGSAIEWVEPGAATLGLGQTTAQAGTGLPFDVPFSGPYGVPTGMLYAAAPAVAGDRYLVDAWFQVLEGGGNNRTMQIAIQLDGADIFESAEYALLDSESKTFHVRTIYAFVATNASPEFGAGIKASGAGPDVTACCLSVTRLTPSE